jgi:hypothetical protein
MTAFSTHAPTLPLSSILLARGGGEQTHDEVEGAIGRIESLGVEVAAWPTKFTGLQKKRWKSGKR